MEKSHFRVLETHFSYREATNMSARPLICGYSPSAQLSLNLSTYTKNNMKIGFPLICLTMALAASSLSGATVIITDSFTATNVGSGFLLGQGVNSDINPPTTTRLTGTAIADLYYIRKGNKGETAYSIATNAASTNNFVNITQGTQSGRFTLSQLPGTNAFDFGSALGTATATPQNPVVYDLNISMANKVNVGNTNNVAGRMTFAFGTTEGGGGTWSFGIQILPVNSGGGPNYYNIFKRIRILSSGLGSELNASITNAATQFLAASEVNFRMRVTDAGAQTGTNYNSRVQVSADAGATWFYDTAADVALTNGFRFDTAARFVTFDQAPNGGAQTYDNFSITTVDPVVNGGTLTISNNAGTATVSVQGTPGQSYVVERSLDLISWSGVYTNTAAANGSLQFSEAPSTSPSFYRSRTE